MTTEEQVDVLDDAIAQLIKKYGREGYSKDTFAQMAVGICLMHKLDDLNGNMWHIAKNSH